MIPVLEISGREDTTADVLPWCFLRDGIWRRRRYRKTYNGILIFIHAGTASCEDAYLLFFLTPISLRIQDIEEKPVKEETAYDRYQAKMHFLRIRIPKERLDELNRIVKDKLQDVDRCEITEKSFC